LAVSAESGTITAKELRAILQRGDSRLTLNEVYEIIDDFDTNNDGELNLEEFVEAFAVIGGDVMASEKVNANVYDKRVEQHLVRIKGLFNKLDTDKSGKLDAAEMKRVIELYSGEKFVYDDFLGWYDSNGSHGDGSFDVKEFGWYIADCAGIDVPEKMVSTMDEFEAAIKEVQRQKQKEQASGK